MDTQGHTNMEFSAKDGAAIGTLSYLMSSLLCYNLQNRLNSETLHQIYVCICT